jgi:hypothetical protein
MNYTKGLLTVYAVLICSIFAPATAQRNNTSERDNLPDFSYCGYRASDDTIPDVPVKAILQSRDGNLTDILQSAVDKIAKLPIDKNGFRGTLLLSSGDFHIEGSIRISASGVVIRGSGAGDGGTRIIATGKDRRTLVSIEGINDKKTVGDTLFIANDYVPAGAMEFSLKSVSNLKKGDKITITRPSTKEWIDILKTSQFGGGISALGWKPGVHNIHWDRIITDISGSKITIDAPLTTALEAKYGGGFVIPYKWDGRIENVGLENLSLISEYDADNPKDEAHSWMGITVASASDVWVRNVVFSGFAGSAVFVLETAKRVTVENCKSLNPVSEIGGGRRNTFFTMGQQCLFQRLYSEYGIHDFALGFCAPGPNAFVQCHAYLPFSYSGSVSSWASGALFDIVNIEGQALRFANLYQDEQGAGWNAANSVFWQCSPSRMECFSPPTATNWAFGAWSEFVGDGYWEESNNHIQPRSLYYSQLSKRLGDKYTDRANLVPVGTEASTSPTVEQAQTLTRLATEPAIRLCEWIDRLLNSCHSREGGKQRSALANDRDTPPLGGRGLNPLEIRNGWLIRSNAAVVGKKHGVTWWNGSVRPDYLNRTASPHLTRFVPGRTGTGLTDDIDSVVTWMKRGNILAIDHNYGLWYDRRRDDHERIRRIDGNVWAPFYEQPFARSGQGTAYDGLSRYDLTKYNDWYWRRLKKFAEAADENNLVLLHQNYFQHNIIEAGAHWADSPWRPENNINYTGFPEPAPYAGDKRIFLAEQFYDISHPVRRELHKAYIRQCLENFRGTTSVIHLTSEEYTGPLHFVQFWLDVISEWEAETGEHPLIALSATKDVQDAILADSVRSKTVDVIDIRYWFYRADGTVYAPLGGLNLAPRQHARLVKPGSASFESVYRAVAEYREKYPEKAVIYYADGYLQHAWAAFMAGGSMAALPIIENKEFLKAAALMKPVPELSGNGRYVLGNDQGFIVYTSENEVDKTICMGDFNIMRINPKTGNTDNSGKSSKINVFWLKK